MLTVDQIDNWNEGVQITDRGPWAQTASGRRFYPLDPKPEDFAVEDIAHHLSLVNRYSGATEYPYSVAQHSLLVGQLAEDLFPRDRGIYHWALAHDMAEFMLGDHIRPVKVLLTEFGEIEDRTMRAIAKWLDLPVLTPTAAIAVKHCDMLASAIEKKVMHPHSEKWFGLPEPIPGYDLWVTELPWRSVRTAFGRAIMREFFT